MVLDMTLYPFALNGMQAYEHQKQLKQTKVSHRGAFMGGYQPMTSPPLTHELTEYGFFR